MPVKILKNSIQCANFRVKFKDIFDLKAFYEVMKEWLLEYEWAGVNSNEKLDGEKWETLYLEKEDPPNFKEMWWWWRLQKIPYSNSYYKWHLDINSHIIFMTTTEVVRDGKKFKAHKGEIEVDVSAFIEFDYDGSWSKHPILTKLNEVFPKKIFKKELYDKTKLELYREVYIFQAFIKKWFKLFTFLPYEENAPFHPSKAFPSWKK